PVEAAVEQPAEAQAEEVSVEMTEEAAPAEQVAPAVAAVEQPAEAQAEEVSVEMTEEAAPAEQVAPVEATVEQPAEAQAEEVSVEMAEEAAPAEQVAPVEAVVEQHAEAVGEQVSDSSAELPPAEANIEEIEVDSLEPADVIEQAPQAPQAVEPAQPAEWSADVAAPPAPVIGVNAHLEMQALPDPALEQPSAWQATPTEAAPEFGTPPAAGWSDDQPDIQPDRSLFGQAPAALSEEEPAPSYAQGPAAAPVAPIELEPSPDWLQSDGDVPLASAADFITWQGESKSEIELQSGADAEPNSYVPLEGGEQWSANQWQNSEALPLDAPADSGIELASAADFITYAPVAEPAPEPVAATPAVTQPDQAAWAQPMLAPEPEPRPVATPAPMPAAQVVAQSATAAPAPAPAWDAQAAEPEAIEEIDVEEIEAEPIELGSEDVQVEAVAPPAQPPAPAPQQTWPQAHQPAPQQAWPQAQQPLPQQAWPHAQQPAPQQAWPHLQQPTPQQAWPQARQHVTPVQPSAPATRPAASWPNAPTPQPAPGILSHAAPAPTAAHTRSAVVPGEYRVIVHTLEGQVKRGILRNANLDAESLDLEIMAGQPPLRMPTARLKAVFFQLVPGARPPPPQGQKLRVTFIDGRQVAGFAPAYDPNDSGFFLLPADTRTNPAERIYIYRAAIKSIARG
ncbi:MAG: DUF6982 domain-containing protein, partial [Myxococcales bacterium]